MPSLKDMRSRIANVQNTQQITKAMKMVSAAKLKRAQDRIVGLRPYARGLLSVIADIAVTQRVKHPLLQPVQNPKKVLCIVINSDRGLCGAFNSNVNRFAEIYYKENKGKYETLDFLFVGKKANDFFARRGIKGVDYIHNMAREIRYTMAADIAAKLMHQFSQGHYDEVRVIYNEFKSAIAQNLVSETLLPIDVQHSRLNSKESKFSKDLIFEPEPLEIIEDLLKKHFAVQIYRCLSESVAAEHAARMTAMENATNNAKEVISTMTLNYNKLRQAAITTELIEITSGAEALKG